MIKKILPWLIIPCIWLGMMVSLAIYVRPDEAPAVSILSSGYEVFEPELGPKWYLITRDDEIVGYRRLVISEQEVEQRPYLIMEESKLQVPVGGTDALVMYDLTSESDTSFSPVRIEGEMSIGQLSVALKGERQGDMFAFTLKVGDEALEREVSVEQGVMTAAGLYPRLMSLEWVEAQERAFQVFDPFTQVPREYLVRYQGEKVLTVTDGTVGKQFSINSFGITSDVVLDQRGNLYSEAADGLLVQRVDIETVSTIYRELN